MFDPINSTNCLIPSGAKTYVTIPMKDVEKLLAFGAVCSNFHLVLSRVLKITFAIVLSRS